jgi:hypothetical protein
MTLADDIMSEILVEVAASRSETLYRRGQVSNGRSRRAAPIGRGSMRSITRCGNTP